MSDLNRRSIDEANRYFQGALSRIKDWRNLISSHFQAKAAHIACQQIAPSTIGGITWQAQSEEPMSLRLGYAEYLVAGAIGGLLKNEDLEAELGQAMSELMGGYTAMQKATFGLVHHFLWPNSGSARVRLSGLYSFCIPFVACFVETLETGCISGTWVRR